MRIPTGETTCPRGQFARSRRPVSSFDAGSLASAPTWKARSSGDRLQMHRRIDRGIGVNASLKDLLPTRARLLADALHGNIATGIHRPRRRRVIGTIIGVQRGVSRDPQQLATIVQVGAPLRAVIASVASRPREAFAKNVHRPAAYEFSALQGDRLRPITLRLVFAAFPKRDDAIVVRDQPPVRDWA